MHFYIHRDDGEIFLFSPSHKTTKVYAKHTEKHIFVMLVHFSHLNQYLDINQE